MSLWMCSSLRRTPRHATSTEAGSHAAPLGAFVNSQNFVSVLPQHSRRTECAHGTYMEHRHLTPCADPNVRGPGTSDMGPWDR